MGALFGTIRTLMGCGRYAGKLPAAVRVCPMIRMAHAITRPAHPVFP